MRQSHFLFCFDIFNSPRNGNLYLEHLYLKKKKKKVYDDRYSHTEVDIGLWIGPGLNCNNMAQSNAFDSPTQSRVNQLDMDGRSLFHQREMTSYMAEL